MNPWPRRPILYEINAWVWMGELSRKYGKAITLGDVPPEEWDDLARLGMDALWLMGVWQRSPAGLGIAMADPEILDACQRALPGCRAEDHVGSPYCIKGYIVDDHLGGPGGLAIAREALARRGIRLILDFVPNHTAPDHPWVNDSPEFYISGDADDLVDRRSFATIHGKVFARGRDPYFPAWRDVLQLNAFHPELRRVARETVSRIADQADGIRCDMAMLVMNDVFARTWGQRAGVVPAEEYWPELIRTVRLGHPDFLFIAEAYWDLEGELQRQGFDYCYDKRLYDRLDKGDAGQVRLHLGAAPAYQDRLLRFIENHDERRAAAVFSPAKERVAAMVMATAPGGRLFHEGQFTGQKIRLPVFLSRRPVEPVDLDLQAFYERLMEVIRLPLMRHGVWELLECRGWPDNGSFENLLAWRWSLGAEGCLIIVNYAAVPSQGRVILKQDDLPGKMWRLTDLFTHMVYERKGDEILQDGLYVGLPGWGFHVFQTERIRA